MYDKSDPRAALASAATTKPRTGLVAEEQLATFYDSPPQIDDETGRTWLVRGYNFVVAYSDLKPGAVLTRRAQPDEYVMLLLDAHAEITAASETRQVPANSIAFVPRVTAIRYCPMAERLSGCLQPDPATFWNFARMLTPMMNRAYIFLNSMPGRNPRAVSGSDTTPSTCRSRTAASAAFSAARPSWSTCSTPIAGQGTPGGCRRITMMISSNVLCC